MPTARVARFREIQLGLVLGSRSPLDQMVQADQDLLGITHLPGETVWQALARTPGLGRCGEPGCRHVWDWGDVDAAEGHYYRAHAYRDDVLD